MATFSTTDYLTVRDRPDIVRNGARDIALRYENISITENYHSVIERERQAYDQITVTDEAHLRIRAGNRYWVGGSGSWIDTAHWSDASGGVGGFSVPIRGDDVFIDSNSFASSGTIDTGGGGLYTQNLTFTPSYPVQMTDSQGADWFCYGSVLINDKYSTDWTGFAPMGFWLTSTQTETISIASEVNGFFGTDDIDSKGFVSKYIQLSNLVINDNFESWSDWDANGFNIYASEELAWYARPPWAAPQRNNEIWLRDGTFSSSNFAIYAENNTIEAYSPIVHAGDATVELLPGLVWSGADMWLDYPEGVDPSIHYPEGIKNIIGYDSFDNGFFIGKNHQNDGQAIRIDNLIISGVGGWTYLSMSGSWDIGNFTVSAPNGFLVDFTGDGDPDDIIIADNPVFSNVEFWNIYAGGNIPWDATDGGVDGGSNTNICFTQECLGGYLLSQSGLSLAVGTDYRLITNASISAGSVVAKEDSTVIVTVPNGYNDIDFTSVGATTLSFTPSVDFSGSITSVSLKQITQPSVADNIEVKEFLEGNTDDGKEITFRADTNPIQLQAAFETFANPLAIVTRSQRGTLTKCFVALEDGDFYELQDNVIDKGVTITKVHSHADGSVPSPTTARKMRLSWRDNSKQLCRLVQTAIIFTPGTMDYSE